MRNDVKLYLALPVLKEFANLPALLESLNQQTERNFHLVDCVNHYEQWRKQAEYEETVSDNEKSLNYLLSVDAFSVTIIDRASPGNGWLPKKGGVGWARKVAMDVVEQQADASDIIISIDADTYYPPNYLAAIKATLLENTRAVGLAVPYY
ncbi:MAG: glycosyltransferase family A protein, partial [Bacteroidales bacterium]